MYDIIVVFKFYFWFVGCKFIDGFLGLLFIVLGWLKIFGVFFFLLNVFCIVIYNNL